MTDHQLVVATVVPCLAILAVWLYITLADERAFGSSRGSMDSKRASIDAVGTSLQPAIVGLGEAIRAEMRAGFNATDQSLSRLETTVDRINEEIRADRERRIAWMEAQLFSKPD